MYDIVFASATDIAALIRTRQISCVEVVQTHLDRITEVNPALNAVVDLDVEAALSVARQLDAAGVITGPLHGVPVTIKSNIGVKNLVCACGTPGYANHRPTEDAVMVQRLRDAGAIILGTTNMPELGIAFETDNLLYGRSNNPYDLTRTPGGSSGGEAAIIAAGGSALGLGNDGAGSIRVPAAFCGIAGIKPTTGRIPVTGHISSTYAGFFPGVAQDGPLARTIADLNNVLPIICGPDGRDFNVIPMPIGDMRAVDVSRLRVAYYTDDDYITPEPAVIKAVEDAARALKDTGTMVIAARPEVLTEAYDIRIGFYGAVTADSMDEVLREMGTETMSPLMQRFMDMTSAYHHATKSELLGLTADLGNFREQMTAFMHADRFDAILCPVYARVAVPHGESDFRDASYSMAFNLTGWPAATVRAGTSPDGLPVGVQIAALPWREDITLALAQAIETALGGYQRPSI